MSLPRRLGGLDRADSEQDEARPARWADGVGMSGGAEKQRPVCSFRRHYHHPNDRICDLCGSTVDKTQTAVHERNHRWQAGWEDKVEMLEAQLAHLQAEFEQVRGQWETVERLVAPGVSHMLGMMGEADDVPVRPSQGGS